MKNPSIPPRNDTQRAPFCSEVCLWQMFLRLWFSCHPPEGIKIIVTYWVQVLFYCLFKMGKHKKENRRRYVKERKWRIREKKRIEAQEAWECSNSAGTCSDSAGCSYSASASASASASDYAGSSDSADPQEKMKLDESYPVKNTATWDEGKKLEYDPLYTSFLRFPKNKAALKRLLNNPL